MIDAGGYLAFAFMPGIGMTMLMARHENLTLFRHAQHYILAKVFKNGYAW
jgi:hypothetical protein